MSQVSNLEKGSIVDFFGQPSAPANPPSGQCRMFYRSDNDTFNVVDSAGVSLLGGAPINSPTFTGTPAAPQRRSAPTLRSLLPQHLCKIHGRLHRSTMECLPVHPRPWFRLLHGQRRSLIQTMWS